METGTKKSKILYLAKIFLESTDEHHGLTRQEILKELEGYGITANRKTIYSDIETLSDFGIEILHEQRNGSTYYYTTDRLFELTELKLLVDAVQVAKFMSEKKSETLIKKLESLTSKHEAKQLQRQVLIDHRVKSANENVYYAIDAIQNAIENNFKVRFQYFNWNTKKERVLRHDGAFYEISPWALIWDDEYYYLLGFDQQSNCMKHYRVDKMLNISITHHPREGRETFESLNLQNYSKGLFRMFGGTIMEVKLNCTNDLAGVIIDQFGKDVMILPADDTHFNVTVTVSLSRHFLTWLCTFTPKIKILSPDCAIQKLKTLLADSIKLYDPQQEDSL